MTDRFQVQTEQLHAVARDLNAVADELANLGPQLSAIRSEINAAGPLAMSALGQVASAQSAVASASRDLHSICSDLSQRLRLLEMTQSAGLGGLFAGALSFIENMPPFDLPTVTDVPGQGPTDVTFPLPPGIQTGPEIFPVPPGILTGPEIFPEPPGILTGPEIFPEPPGIQTGPEIFPVPDLRLGGLLHTETENPPESPPSEGEPTPPGDDEPPPEPAPVPNEADQVADYAGQNQGAAQPGYAGDKPFENDGRGGGEVLPQVDEHGNPITYREYDIKPYQQGVNRGAERVVIGSDGSAYYTNDHYGTFSKFR